MAAGVSMATIPTMSGMIASLSGLMGTTYLKRKVDYETQIFEDTLTLDH
jgi:biopolymer transport protein ExbB